MIVAASSINSPKLLMLSGIGPAAHLAEHGIEVIADRPGVGANLQDHLEVYMQFAAAQPITLYKYWNLLGKAWVGAQWLLTGKGLGASNQFEACAFIRVASRASIIPTSSITSCPSPCAMTARRRRRARLSGPCRADAVAIARGGHAALGRPEDAPVIRFNYMSHPIRTGRISAPASA